MLIYRLIYASAALAGAYFLSGVLLVKRPVPAWLCWFYAVLIFVAGTTVLSPLKFSELAAVFAQFDLPYKPNFRFELATPIMVAWGAFKILKLSRKSPQ